MPLAGIAQDSALVRLNPQCKPPLACSVESAGGILNNRGDIQILNHIANSAYAASYWSVLYDGSPIRCTLLTSQDSTFPESLISDRVYAWRRLVCCRMRNEDSLIQRR